MDAVTPGMRDQRRRRREAERAGRGEVRRRPPAPHPVGLRAQGWTRPTAVVPAPAARLLGATTAPVAITDRATVTTAARATTPLALAPPPVTRGPLPAAASLPRPARFAPFPPAAVLPAAPAGAPVDAPADAPAAAEVPTTVASTAPAAATVDDAPAPPVTPATSTPPAAPIAPPAAPLPSDLFAHRLGLSPANTPAPRSAATPAEARHSRVGRRPRDPWADSSGRRGRVLLAAAAVVVVLGGVGTAIGVTVAGRDDGRSATTTVAAADGVVSDVATWLSGNITTQQRIVAPDATTARDLNGRGVPVDTLGEGAEPPVGAVVVTTSDTADPPAVARAGAATSQVLLATFTDGGGRTVTVGEVVDRGVTQMQDDLDDAQTTAQSACRGLRANAAVRIDSDVEPVFTSGRLDLRAATMLAAIAQDQRVSVVDAPQDAAERRAGRPVRTLVVQVEDTQAVREIAATARSPYAPDVEPARAGAGVPEGSLQLTFPAGAAVTMPFQ